MAKQFDVFRTVSGSLVVIIQSDLLSELQTRVVAFLAEGRTEQELFRRLTPRVTIGGSTYTLEMHTLATLSTAELGTKVGDVADQSDKVTRAIDALLSGI